MPLAYRICAFLEKYYGVDAYVRADDRIGITITHVDCEGYVESVTHRVIDANVDALREHIAPAIDCYDDRPYVC